MTDKNRGKLIELFSTKLKNKKEEELLFSLGILGLDPEWFQTLVLSNYDPLTRNLKIDKVVDFTIRRMTEVLQEGVFIASLEGNDCEQELVLGLQKLIELKLEFNILFLLTYIDDLSIIHQYKNYLLSKKRQLTLRDKWGDPDFVSWNKLVSEFASEKLTAGIWDNMFVRLAPSVQEHLTFCNQGKFGAAFVIHSLNSGSGENGPLHERVEPIIKDGREYEIFLRNQIQEMFPELIVELTAISGDQGADLIICSPDTKIAIQAKHYSSPVGNAAVQEIYAAKQFYEADDCLVVCKTSYTPAAKVLAGKTGVILTTDSEYLSILGELVSMAKGIKGNI